MEKQSSPEQNAEEHSKGIVMSISNLTLERQLLESDAGQSVYDALIQANVDLRTVSLDLVKDMLNAECRHRRLLGQSCRSERILSLI